MRYELLPGQRRFLELGTPYRAFIGGAGSGKTWIGAAFALAHMKPGTVGMICSPTYRMLSDVTSKQVLDFLYAHKATFEYRRSEEKLVYGDSLTYFRSGEVPQRLRGVNLSWAWCDEAALMDPEVWQVLMGRLRVGRPEAWCTTTPAGFGWIYKTFAERDDPNYSFTQASARENTHLSADFISNLESSYTGAYAKQEIEGAFTTFEGMVYEEFSREIHVCDPFQVPEGWERIRAVDFGYINPFCCLWGALDHDRRLYIYDEHYQARQLIGQHAEAILSRKDRKDLYTVADHDAQDAAELRRYGIFTRPARKNVVEGIQKCKARLVVQPDGYPRLFITANCVNLIKELQTYSWTDHRPGSNDREEPRKELDHAADSLRYLVQEIDGVRAGVGKFRASDLGL